MEWEISFKISRIRNCSNPKNIKNTTKFGPKILWNNGQWETNKNRGKKKRSWKFIRDFLPGQPQKHGFLFISKYCLKKNVSRCFI